MTVNLQNLNHLTALFIVNNLRKFNKTIGYDIYDTCSSDSVTGRVAINIANSDKVIGVSGTPSQSYSFCHSNIFDI